VQATGTTPIVVIRQTSPIQVSFSVPQQELAEVQARMKAGPLHVKALVPSGAKTNGDDPDIAVDGVLSFLGGAVDPSTGTIPCKADFPNKDDALWPGAFVRVVLTLGTREGAVVVPATAVQSSQQGPFAFVVKSDNTVEMRPVTSVGAPGGRAVIEQGLAAGDKVVVDVQLALVPGARIAERPPVGSMPPAVTDGAKDAQP